MRVVLQSSVGVWRSLTQNIWMRVVQQSSVGVWRSLTQNIWMRVVQQSIVGVDGDLLPRIYECELFCSLVWGLMEISYTEYMNASCPAVQFGGWWRSLTQNIWMRVVLQSSVGVDGDLLHRIYECELFCSLVWGLMEISYTEYMNASCPAV